MPTLPDAANANAAAPLPNGRWSVDPGRSSCSFTAKGTWGLIPVKGRFERMRGSLEVAGGPASGELVLDADSLNTKSKARDKHLRSPDFFDVERHREIIFRLHDLELRSHAEGSAVGTLEVCDVSHPLELGLAVARLDDDDLRLSAETRVERSDVGLTWNRMGMMRGDIGLAVDVTLTRD